MTSEMGIQIFVLVLLIGGSAFFSMSETALMSITKLDVRHMISNDVKGAKLIETLIDDTPKLLGSILVGNNLVNIGASALATVLATDIFGSAGVGIATGVMTLFVLIFGEITPKSVASQNSQKTALFVSKPIFVIVMVFSPIVKILMVVTNVLIKLFGGNSDANESFITAEKLKTIVTVSHEEGVIETDEKEMLYNVFNFGDSYAKDVMIPRTDMVAIDLDASYKDVMQIFKQHQFSRMPVFKDSFDNIVGMLYIKDLLMDTELNDSFTISSVLREAFFIHEFTKTNKLFKKLQLKKIGMAVVVDEYGGTSGLITIEDLIERIVGDIDDEYDLDEDDFIQLSETEYLIEGSFRITELNEKTGLNIVSDEFDSIGGYIVGMLDRFPKNGEKIKAENAMFLIEDADNKRINRLKLTIVSDETKE